MPTIVYFSLPAHGHLNPSLPVVEELVRRGYRVHCFSLERFRAGIEQGGAFFHDYGPRFDVPASGPGPFTRLDTTVNTLIGLTRVVLEDHLDAVRQLHPDGILHDAFSPWGKFVAQALHLPAIVSVPSLAVNDRIAMGAGAPDLEFGRTIAERMPHWRASLTDLNREFGVSAISNPFDLMHAYGDLNVVYTSRAFQPLADAFEEGRFQFVGPSIPDRTPASQFPFEKLDVRPLLFISLGSVYTDRGPFFQCCAEAFAGGPWQVVMAVGQNMSPGEIGCLPENFLAERWVPQIEILRRARVFITHGGMNSVSEALWHGLPLVVVPQGADQFWIARRVAEIGAGVSLAGSELTAGALRKAVATASEQSSYARAAGEIGRSLRLAGGARRAVDEIEAFLLRSAAR